MASNQSDVPTNVFHCAGFKFFDNFDSGNILQVDLVAQNNPSKFRNPDQPHYVFNIKTKPDCYGTPYENSNRTWFFFGVQGGEPYKLIRINLVDINKQSKMYSQGMAPVFKSVPGRVQNWQRIRDKPTYKIDDGIFTLTFHFNTSDNVEMVQYFAFTYPFTYTELQTRLKNWDNKYLTQPSPFAKADDIYYKRECVTLSLEGRRIDLLTISDHSNITNEMELRLKHLFNDCDVQRPFKFAEKKVIFISARVHPGETPSSFVFNGFEKFILTRDDEHAIALRRKYVFKLIPFLNPDGVVRGHYRTDTRGVNLNRLYLRPSHTLHPSVYAARSIVRYHHFKYEERDESYEPEDGAVINYSKNFDSQATAENLCQRCINVPENETESLNETRHSECGNELNESIDYCQNCLQSLTMEDKIEQTDNETSMNLANNNPGRSEQLHYTAFGHEKLQSSPGLRNFDREQGPLGNSDSENNNITSNHGGNVIGVSASNVDNQTDVNRNQLVTDSCDDVDSGLFLYLDLHGHASKKGIFMYGNHFNDLEKNVECMLLPKLMSINNYNFHFMSCNFTERNMYLRDRRDGKSREGSGRVAIWKLTGCVRSYTLECNYNMGKMTNTLPPLAHNPSRSWHLNYLPKYCPSVYEEVGKALGPSILDMTGDNPNSRLLQSEFRSLSALKEWLRWHICDRYPCFAVSNRNQVPAKLKSMRNRPRLHRTSSRILTTARSVIMRRRSLSNIASNKPKPAMAIVTSPIYATPSAKLTKSMANRFEKVSPQPSTSSNRCANVPSAILKNIHSNRASQLRSKFTSAVISKLNYKDVMIPSSGFTSKSSSFVRTPRSDNGGSSGSKLTKASSLVKTTNGNKVLGNVANQNNQNKTVLNKNITSAVKVKINQNNLNKSNSINKISINNGNNNNKITIKNISNDDSRRNKSNVPLVKNSGQSLQTKTKIPRLSSTNCSKLTRAKSTEKLRQSKTITAVSVAKKFKPMDYETILTTANKNLKNRLTNVADRRMAFTKLNCDKTAKANYFQKSVSYSITKNTNLGQCSSQETVNIKEDGASVPGESSVQVFLEDVNVDSNKSFLTIDDNSMHENDIHKSDVVKWTDGKKKSRSRLLSKKRFKILKTAKTSKNYKFKIVKTAKNAKLIKKRKTLKKMKSMKKSKTLKALKLLNKVGIEKRLAARTQKLKKNLGYSTGETHNQKLNLPRNDEFVKPETKQEVQEVVKVTDIAEANSQTLELEPEKSEFPNLKLKLKSKNKKLKVGTKIKLKRLKKRRNLSESNNSLKLKRLRKMKKRKQLCEIRKRKLIFEKANAIVHLPKGISPKLKFGCASTSLLKSSNRANESLF